LLEEKEWKKGIDVADEIKQSSTASLEKFKEFYDYFDSIAEKSNIVVS